MAASLSVDGKLHAMCSYGNHAIWKYPNGKVWRDWTNDSTCQDNPSKVHTPER